MTSEDLLVLLGALAGGYVNGLTGFGTALTAMPFWLHAMTPAIAAQLAAAAGAIGQLQTFNTIRHALSWQRLAPFILAGLVGVPLGTWLLPHVGVRSFKLGVGLVLVAYCGFILLANSLRWSKMSATVGASGRVADAGIGFGGGVLAGLAGLSGPLPTIWATFKPWSRDEKRALFQSFNFTILSAMLISSAAAGLMTGEFWRALIVVLPGTIVGVQLGKLTYRRLDDRRFDRLVLALLLASGVMLVAGNL